MNVIVNESQYKTLINEDMGVSRASIDYANIIYRKLIPIVIGLVNTKRNGKEKIVIGIKDLSNVWKKDIESYLEFPIEEIRIDLDLTVKSEMRSEFATGGGAEQIESSTEEYSFIKRPSKNLPKYILSQLDDTLNAKFDFSIDIRQDFNEESIDDLLNDLLDTISHESNHMLEFYQRYLKGAPGINTTLVYSGNKNYNIPADIYNVWKEFTTMLYFSEPYEMRAMVQEMYSVRLRMPYEKFKEHRYYKAATIMENFNADVMFDNLITSIEKHNPDSMVIIMKNLFNWFKRDYMDYSAAFKSTPNRRVEKSKHILDLMKAFQPRINNAGRKMKRNFDRLYSLSPN